MITEAQRRALFALREALHLCEGAGVVIAGNGYREVSVKLDCSEWATDFCDEDVTAFLAEHPEQ